jgi:hypothetical protein
MSPDRVANFRGVHKLSGARIVGPQDTVREVVEGLGSKSEAERNAALRRIRGSEELRRSDSVRSAFSRLLVRIAQPSDESGREGAINSRHLSEVVSTAMMITDPENAKFLVRLDHPQIDSTLLPLGAAAVNAIVRELEIVSPKAASSQLRLRLVGTLRSFSAAAEFWRGAVVADVAVACYRGLTSSNSPDELVAWLGVADSLDQEDVVGVGSRIARSSETLIARGITNPQRIQVVQDAARRVLNRRLTQRVPPEASSGPDVPSRETG